MASLLALPGSTALTLREVLLASLPSLASHKHAHKLVVLLATSGSRKPKLKVKPSAFVFNLVQVWQHVKENLASLINDKYGRDVVEALVLSRSPGDKGQGQLLMKQLVRLVVGDEESERGEPEEGNIMIWMERSRDLVVAELMVEEVRSLASIYLTNKDEVVRKVGERWRGDRIKMFSWMQDVAFGEQPRIEFNELPELICLVEFVNEIVHHGEQRKLVRKSGRNATLKLVKYCVKFLRSKENTKSPQP